MCLCKNSLVIRAQIKEMICVLWTLKENQTVFTEHPMTLGLMLIKQCVMRVKRIVGCPAALCRQNALQLSMHGVIAVIRIYLVGKIAF